MGKSTINGPCSIAMLVYQRVYNHFPMVFLPFPASWAPASAPSVSSAMSRVIWEAISMWAWRRLLNRSKSSHMSLAMVLLSYCYGITYALYDQHFSTITVLLFFSLLFQWPSQDPIHWRYLPYMVGLFFRANM